MIRAAGAIIWRENSPFELEVLVIHRPQYDDWSFPKGKVDDGESPIAAAYREVKEETGVDAIFGQYLIPFEVVSLLLLAALVGAIVIARRD